MFHNHPAAEGSGLDAAGTGCHKNRRRSRGAKSLFHKYIR
jgi:hypothetical protein